MDGQMKVITACVGHGNGCGNSTIRVVPSEADSAGSQIGNHRVCDKIGKILYSCVDGLRKTEAIKIPPKFDNNIICRMQVNW